MNAADQMLAADGLVAAASAILFALGALHLKLTFSGRRLWPRDDSVRAAMQDSAVRISDEVTMWQAWVSFNATHSVGAMLFGAVFGYLALGPAALLRESWYLQGVGLLTLATFSAIGARYWFSVPRRGVWIATVCYVAGMLLYRI